MKIGKAIRIALTIIGFALDMAGMVFLDLRLAIVGGVVGLMDIISYVWLHKKKRLSDIMKNT